MQGLFQQGVKYDFPEDTPIFAILMLDGRIYYDTEAKYHLDAISRLSLDLEQVKDGGFIIRDTYCPGSHDAAKAGAKARRRTNGGGTPSS